MTRNRSLQCGAENGPTDAGHSTRLAPSCSVRALRVGAESDPLERQAERMAADAAGTGSGPGATGHASEGIQSGARLEQGMASLGAGTPLHESTRRYFEGRFAADFSRVRIHSDRDACASAERLGALGYTIGNHIVLGGGSLRPGSHLLAHELAHVVQYQRGADGNTLRPYRKKSPNSPNYDANSGGGAPETAHQRGTGQPLIQLIRVKFTGVKQIAGEKVPTGVLDASYYTKGMPASAVASRVTGVPAVGGFPSSGLTDLPDAPKGNRVKRVEGWGYNDSPVPAANAVGTGAPANHYFMPRAAASASMSYAIFFTDKEAVHLGPATSGSLGCVHVPNVAVMRQLNYHSLAGTTTVKTEYAASVLQTVCCERQRLGNVWPRNPCKKGGADPGKCP